MNGSCKKIEMRVPNGGLGRCSTSTDQSKPLKGDGF
jgi:hypothetical protein